MTSMRGRGRGARGGPVGDSYRRGSWRGGPPGSAGYNRTPARAEYVSRGGHAASADSARAKPEEKAKGFQTDTDISAATRTSERELKPWNPDEHANSGATANGGGTTSTAGSASALRDALTFGAGMSSTPWDQFDTNERLFGVKTTYEEEIYTTKLDRSAPDYKKRERDADRQATEILTKPSNNPHVAEERNHSTPPGGDGKDEEEKYSGVVRNPNAYVPPGARKTGGAPSRKDTPAKDAKEAAPAARAAAPPATVTTPVPMPPVAAPAPKSNGPSASSIGPPLAKESDKKPARAPSPIPGPGARSSADPAVDPAIASLGPPPAPTMTRSTSSVPPAQANGGDGTAPTALPPIGAAVNQAREFVESERQRVVARKQSLVKNERAHVFADLKAWQTKFSVPLPLPKDILPILAKDEGKQKEIEAKADKALHEIKSKSPQKTPTPLTPEAARPLPKKIPMKIPEIPPFRKKVPPAVPVPETAAQNITLVTSPTPSNTSITSGATHAKLNPNASAFVFKPNPSAVAFKPAAGGSGGASLAPAPPTAIESSVNSPASRTGPLPGPSTAVSPVAPSAAMVSSPIPAHASAPAAPKNPFYRDGPPKRISVNPRDDFNPFKHSQVPSASTVAPQWPYTGRRSSLVFGGAGAPMPHAMMNANSTGGGFDDEGASSPHPSHQPAPPHMVPPPNLMQFYRYQPGPPNMQPNMMGPMFGHAPAFMPPQMTHSPSHMQPPPGNGMPMYFPNNIPPNAHFIPPQMQFHPNGPGRPGPGGPMFYPGQMSPHQAPQMQPQMSFQGQPTPPQPHFQQPLPAQGPPPPFEGSPAP